MKKLWLRLCRWFWRARAPQPEPGWEDRLVDFLGGKMIWPGVRGGMHVGPFPLEWVLARRLSPEEEQARLAESREAGDLDAQPIGWEPDYQKLGLNGEPLDPSRDGRCARCALPISAKTGGARHTLDPLLCPLCEPLAQDLADRNLLQLRR
jgi:hypothetical protein